MDKLREAIEHLLNTCPPIDANGEEAHAKARALLAEPVADEPVAWRYRYKDRGNWLVISEKPAFLPAIGFECEPLYTRPAPAPATTDTVKLENAGYAAISETTERRPLTWEQVVRSTITDPATAERILSVPHDATGEEAEKLLMAPAESGGYPPLPPPDYVAGVTGMLGEDCYAASTVRRLLDADRAQRVPCQVLDLATPSGGQEAGPEEERIEASYWRFDARHKGYGQWRQAPMSERDAFKAEMRNALGAEKVRAEMRLVGRGWRPVSDADRAQRAKP